MNMRRLKALGIENLSAAEVLGAIGLARRPSTASVVLGTLGTFGLGLVVGASVALLATPRPGHELRRSLREAVRRGERRAAEAEDFVEDRIS